MRMLFRKRDPKTDRRHPVVRFLARLGYYVVFFVLVFSGTLISCQHRLIYLPKKYPDDWRTMLPPDAQPFTYDTSQGTQTGVFLPGAEAEEKRVLFFFAGNASLALDWLTWIPGIQREGVSIVLLDYPGYGANSGAPNPDRIRESIREAWKVLKSEQQEQVQDAKVLLFGHSLGAAAALIAAEELEASRAVLISPFTSTYDMAKRMVGSMFANLLHHRFDNRARLKNLSARDFPPSILVFHGTNDNVIPVEMSRDLAKEFPDLIHYIEVNAATHDDLVYTQRDKALTFLLDEKIP